MKRKVVSLKEVSLNDDDLGSILKEAPIVRMNRMWLCGELLRLEYTSLTKAIRGAERALTQAMQSFESSLEKAGASMAVAERDAFYEMQTDEYHELSQEFPQIMRRALLLAAFSRFEYSLWTICHSAADAGLSPKKPPAKDFKMVNARTFLKGKGICIDVAKVSTEWDRMEIVRTIRNACAHGDGRIPKDNEYTKVREFIKQSADIQLNEQGRVVLASGFVDHVIESSEAVHTALIQRLEERVAGRTRKEEDDAVKSIRKRNRKK